MGKLSDGRAAPISLPFAEHTSLLQSPKWLVCLVLAVVLVASFGVYLFFPRRPQAMNPPQSFAISACRDLIPGVRRIRADFGIRIDTPEKAFTVHEGLRDMPPGMLYVVKLKDTDAHIVVWHDDDIFKDFKIAYPVFSKHVEDRNVRDAAGRIFGTDRWGYLQSGDRWRYVRFSTGDAVGYEPTPAKQANLLDQVVNSACFSRGEIPQN